MSRQDEHVLRARAWHQVHRAMVEALQRQWPFSRVAFATVRGSHRLGACL